MRHSERLALIGKTISKMQALSAAQNSAGETNLLAICAIWQLATIDVRPTNLQGSASDTLLLHILNLLQPDRRPLSRMSQGQAAANNSASQRTVHPGAAKRIRKTSCSESLLKDVIDNVSIVKPAPLQDDSNFARICTSIASKLECTKEELTRLCAFFTRDELSQNGEIFADPCLIGWVYQSTLKKKSSQQTPTSFRQEEIGKATQWFTPEWIADFLIDETVTTPAMNGQLNAKTMRFLDPACGAGHILVKAFGQLIRIHQNCGDALDSSISSALRQSFGLDIDPLMLHLCAFSLYVSIRQQDKTNCEFPTPNLFIVSTTSGDKFGSLLLEQTPTRRATMKFTC